MPYYSTAPKPIYFCSHCSKPAGFTGYFVLRRYRKGPHTGGHYHVFCRAKAEADAAYITNQQQLDSEVAELRSEGLLHTRLTEA